MDLELELNLEEEARMDLYCDVLLRYMLVGSVLGECDLYHRMGQALDRGDADSLVAAMQRFDALPEDLKARVLEGDPTLSTMMEQSGSEPQATTTSRTASA